MSTEQLEERVKFLEDLLFSFMNGEHQPIQINGNITAFAEREPSQPMRVVVGRDADNNLYIFFQEEFAGQERGAWAGIENYKKVNEGGMNAHVGYGFYPGRVWFKNFLADADGNTVQNAVVAEKIYLQTPAHRNVKNEQWEKPAKWENGKPLDANGNEMGGINYDPSDLGTYIARDGDNVVLVHNGNKVVLA